jgi:protein-disulfide isomerase
MRAALGRALATLALVLLGADAGLCGPASGAAPAATPAIVATDPAADARLVEYLQKRFKIDDVNNVKLGPAVQSPLPGLLGRGVNLSNSRGETATLTLFTDKDISKLIVGQYFDLSRDPWGRSDMSKAHLTDRPELGAADAPVTVVEFADFECPHCARAYTALETLARNTHKGQMRLIYKSFPLGGHPWAQRAAVAAECGRLQNPDSFWEFAREFYSKQGSINLGNVDTHAKQVATRRGLDLQVFDACVTGTAAAKRVQEDVADGRALRVSSTPTLFINGIPLVGPDDNVIEWVITEELKAATKSAAAR